nr:g-type lectin s-receptor-like serine/threonine-protein kinase rks1 [Quercus suber]
MSKSLILIVLFLPFCISYDTLAPKQFINDGQSLISKENNFALGFFSPSNSSHRYLGIWYVKVKKQTVVWVANRNDPINDSSGVLSINQFGNLVLHESSNRLVWSTNVSVKGTTTTSSVAQLQDSGNLVLVQDNNQNGLLWQSFDYPTDTFLPKMKLGVNLITGLDRFLTSWKSQDDPGYGDCFYKMILYGSPEVFLYKGSTPYWRPGPWPWHSSSPATVSSGYKFDFVNNEDEVSYAYFLDDPSIISRLVVDNTGLLQQLMWNEGDLQWKELWSAPKYRCDKYRQCGTYSKCSPDNINRFECMCLPGYEPKSPRDWYLRDGSEGCVRKKLGLSMCRNGEGFVKVQRLKGPDSANAVWMDMNILENSDEGWDLNICVDASELAKYTRMSKGFRGNKRLLAITILCVAVPFFLVSLLVYMLLMKKRKTKGSIT